MEIRVDMLGKACLTGSDDRWITLETDDDYCDEEESWMFKVSGDLTYPLFADFLARSSACPAPSVSWMSSTIAPSTASTHKPRAASRSTRCLSCARSLLRRCK